MERTSGWRRGKRRRKWKFLQDTMQDSLMDQILSSIQQAATNSLLTVSLKFDQIICHKMASAIQGSTRPSLLSLGWILVTASDPWSTSTPFTPWKLRLKCQISREFRNNVSCILWTTSWTSRSKSIPLVTSPIQVFSMITPSATFWSR
jgi:hypothetical protein